MNKTEPGYSKIIQATVWKLVQDLIWNMKIQPHQLIRLYLTPQLSILLLIFTTEPGPFQQIQATVWEMMQDQEVETGIHCDFPGSGVIFLWLNGF